MIDTTVLLAGDTRDVDNRCSFPHYDGEIGELWVRQREDGAYALLSADKVVVVTREFLHRLTRTDPRLVGWNDWPNSIVVGSAVNFYEHGHTVRYKVIRTGPSHMMWLLERQEENSR